MSNEALTWALEQPVARSTHKFVLAILANYADPGGHCYPSIDHLAEVTSQDRKTVLAGLDFLCSEGLIEDSGSRVGRTGQIIVYRLPMRNSPKNGTVPFFLPNSPVFPSEQAQKRDTYTSGIPKDTKNSLTLFPSGLEDAEKIYQLYPRKVSRKKGIKAIRRALKHFGLELIESKTKAFSSACAANQPDTKFIPYPATWFNDEAFNDESTWPQPNGHSKPVKTLREKEFDRLMRETDRGIAEIDACADRIEAENRRLA